MNRETFDSRNLTHDMGVMKRLACAVGLMLVACGDTGTPEVPGEPSDPSYIQQGRVENGYPAVGYITGESRCTATLIDPSWVLTARHCKELTLFSTGTSDRDFVKHELTGQRYKQPGNEVTLIRLAKPIRNIPLAKLNRGAPPRVGDKCTSVGFGFHTNPDGTETLGRKRSAISSVIDSYGGDVVVEEGTGSVDGGDSGGPLVCNGEVIGVAFKKDDDVWAKKHRGTYHVLDLKWVTDTMANPEAANPPEPDEPIGPEPEEVAPVMRLLGSSGELCPEGSLTFEDGRLLGPEWTAVKTAGTKLCKIRLAMTRPAGYKFDKLALGWWLNAPFYNLPRPANVSVTIPTVGSVSLDREIGYISRGRFEAVALSSPTCGDPARPELPVTINIAAYVPTGQALELAQIDARFASSDGSVWTRCSKQ
jgi:hypothetical protein